MYVMLDPKCFAPFRRSVRDENGGHLRTLFFEARTPQFLTGDDFRAIVDDIGQTLCLCNVREDGKPLPLEPEEQARLAEKYRKNPPTRPPETVKDLTAKPAKKKEREPEPATA